MRAHTHLFLNEKKKKDILRKLGSKQYSLGELRQNKIFVAQNERELKHISLESLEEK